jgi:hypothetical protein
MKHINTYELFEAAAPLSPADARYENIPFVNPKPSDVEAAKKRIAIEIGYLIEPVYGKSKTEGSKKWLKEEYKIDLQPLINSIKEFEIKASCDQIPNVLRGVKGMDFAKYVDNKINSMIKDFTTKVFTEGGGKGKVTLIKTAYLRSGKDGLAKDIFKKYKNSELSTGQEILIDNLSRYSSELSYAISKGIRRNVDVIHTGTSFKAGEYVPEMEQYKNNIRKWEDGYDSYFKTNNKDKTVLAYLGNVTSAIWEA